MIRRLTPTRALVCAALSFAGIVGAHSLSYVLVASDPHERHHLLHETGHGGWDQLRLAAAAAAVAGLIAFISARFRSRSSAPRLTLTAPALAVLQVGGFLLLECTERLLSGTGGLAAFSEGVVQLGVVVQVIVAIALAVILVVLARVVDLLVGRDRPVTHARSRIAWPDHKDNLSQTLACKGFDVRGPPVPLRI
jgi:hypothetical protein